MNKVLFYMIVFLAWAPCMLLAQDKKKTAPATVCSTPVPSRAAAIDSGKKSAAKTSSKIPACCKGAPSRFTATRTVVKK